MSKRVRVAVIAAWARAEHEISVASARSVIDALDPDRYDIQTIGIGRDGRWSSTPVRLGSWSGRSPRSPPTGDRRAVGFWARSTSCC